MRIIFKIKFFVTYIAITVALDCKFQGELFPYHMDPGLVRGSEYYVGVSYFNTAVVLLWLDQKLFKIRALGFPAGGVGCEHLEYRGGVL